MDVRGLSRDFLQNNREERCDVTKIQHLWNYGMIIKFRKTKMKKISLAKISLFMGINSTASRRVSSTSADTTLLDLHNGDKTLRHVAMVAIFLDLNNPRSCKYGRKKMHVWLSCAWLHSGTKRKPILFFQHLTSLSRKIRELKQRRRRRQRERQKSNRFRLTKHKLCTCITLFCTFLCRRCTNTTWKCLISRFVEDVNTRQRLCFSFPELWYSLLEFNSSKIYQHLTNWTRWNKRDKVWSSANSHFKWRFRSRRRFCCLNSLLSRSRNFATIITWRHTSPLFSSDYNEPYPIIANYHWMFDVKNSATQTYEFSLHRERS